MNEKLALADYLLIGGFFAVMLAVGFYFMNRVRSLKDYFSGGNQVPWWLSGISLYMSSFSAFSFVAYSALSYKHGWVSVTIWWIVVPSIALTTYWFAGRWRRAASTSPLEYIEERYGRGLRQGLAWMGIPMTVMDDGMKLFAIGTLVSVSLGFSLAWGIFLSGTIMLLYTFLGGLWAVLVTDCIQFVVLVLAVIVLLPLSFREVGGVGGFIDKAPEGFFDLTSGDYDWVFLVVGVAFVQFLRHGTAWSFIQRFYSVRTDADARKTGYLVAALYVVGPPVLFLPAMVSRLFLPEVENTNQVYALLCAHLLPAGMMGLVVAAMFSASMSMLSSDYNAVASVFTNDIYKRLLAPRASERSLVWVGRMATLVIGAVALGMGFLVAELGEDVDLIKIMVTLFSVCLPPIAIPMLLGLVSRRVSGAGGLGGFLLGCAAGILAFLVKSIDLQSVEIDLRYGPTMATITSLATMAGVILGTLLRPDSATKRAQVDRFLDGLTNRPTETRSGIRSEPARAEAPAEAPAEPEAPAIFPATIIGVSVGSLGVLFALIVLLTVSRSDWFLSLLVALAMACTGAVFFVVGTRQSR